MRIIISPAKKMVVDTDSLNWRGLPELLTQTEEILGRLRAMSYAELKALWKCSDSIAAENYDRLQTMELRRNLTPAILAYEGIQYQYMCPGVFTNQEFEYVEQHLRILSGFYGLLCPFDGISPYRLEMQAKLKIGEAKDLYEFWGDTIAKSLFADTDCVVNLASKEYSRSVQAYAPPNVRFITCVFGEYTGGKVVEKGTMCKMARGEMVRYMAENQLQSPEELKSFDRLGYSYAPEKSNEETLTFIKTGGI